VAFTALILLLMTWLKSHPSRYGHQPKYYEDKLLDLWFIEKVF